jgi:hypothetical protein
MLIINDEPFITLEVAAKSYYVSELYSALRPELYRDRLARYLTLYDYNVGSYDILLTEEQQLDFFQTRLDRKINGMLEVKVIIPQHIPRNTPEWGLYSEFKLFISKFSGCNTSDFIGCEAVPIERRMNFSNYLMASFVRLSDLINHAKLSGAEINAFFLEQIIINDSQFRELKRLSKITPDSKFNIKQAAGKYLQHFDGVLEETVVEACEYASASYDRDSQQSKPTKENHENNIYDISELLSDTRVNNENIEQLKSALPDAWREVLFENLVTPSNEKTLSFDDEDTPEKLYLALSVYKQVWQGFDSITTNLPKKEQVEEIIKGLNILEPRDIEAMIRLSKPEGLEFGKRPNADKEKWQSWADKCNQKIIN